MSDDRPIGETIEEKIRELGEEISNLRRDFNVFRESLLRVEEESEQLMQFSIELIKRNNGCLKKST